MAKRSVIIKRLREEKKAALEEAAVARQSVDPLNRTVEERSKTLETARLNLTEADARIHQWILQHSTDSIALGEAQEEAKKLRSKLEELEMRHGFLQEAFAGAEATIYELSKDNRELKKFDMNSKRIRRRLNNAHEYIGRLASTLRQHNIEIPAETMGKWASSTHTDEEKEDLDLLMQAANAPKLVDAIGKVIEQIPVPEGVPKELPKGRMVEIHPQQPKDFYSQIQSEGPK